MASLSFLNDLACSVGDRWCQVTTVMAMMTRWSILLAAASVSATPFPSAATVTSSSSQHLIDYYFNDTLAVQDVAASSSGYSVGAGMQASDRQHETIYLGFDPATSNNNSASTSSLSKRSSASTLDFPPSDWFDMVSKLLTPPAHSFLCPCMPPPLEPCR